MCEGCNCPKPCAGCPNALAAERPTLVQAVRARLEDDLTFLEDIQAEEPYELHYELVDQLPTLLSGLLDEPVSMTSLWQTRLVFARHLQTTQAILKLLEAYSQLVFNETATPDEIKEAEENLELTLNALESLAKVVDPKSFLAGLGATEEQFLFDIRPDNSLDASLREPYRQGTLTIEQLLRVQPMLLFSLVAAEPIELVFGGPGDLNDVDLADDEDNFEPI